MKHQKFESGDLVWDEVESGYLALFSDVIEPGDPVIPVLAAELDVPVEELDFRPCGSVTYIYCRKK